ncbi:hypothetical protein [Pedobacter alpinus]|uniref:DUF1761 domain-containing protein n=1 Tax=Pedobacter alpinus TaxID=1590643 RepID=A0ABW5TUN7_9SPHI
MKKIILSGLTAGTVLFILGYGALFFAIRLFPDFFTDYSNPLFNSDGSRDVLFYLHAFVLSLALAWFWERFKGMFKGGYLLRGLEFGFVYAIVSLIPVMWITFSALDVTATMVISWLFYGLIQAIIAGVIFAKINP